MKKAFCCIFLVFMFCGCSANTEKSSGIIETSDVMTTEETTTEETTTKETTTEIQVSDEELNLMQRVLLGKVEIIDTEDGVKKNVTELPYYFEGMDFRCVDLDGDGLNEVILQPPMQGSILHEIDGVIYRYPISNRVTYYEDGTIYGSSGASYSYLFRIKFNETESWNEFIYHAVDGKVYKVYEYEGEQIEFTQEEFAVIQEQYPQIMLDRYEFNHNNIIELLAG